MDPALFSPAALFCGQEGDSSAIPEEADSRADDIQAFVEREHLFPGMVLLVREFSFHPVNANLLWPGSCIFAEWLLEHQNIIIGRRILELGSGTGALAIFLKKSFALDVTTSDYDDRDIEENISYNCKANGIPPLPHIRHTWGQEFSVKHPNWDLIIASDILLYVKQYPNLIHTLLFLLKEYTPVEKNPDSSEASQIKTMEPTNSQSGNVTNLHSKCLRYGNGDDIKFELPYPCFLMSWRRRIPKDDQSYFFSSCEDAGLMVKHLGSRVFCISFA